MPNGYQDSLGDDPRSKIVVDIIANHFRVGTGEIYKSSVLTENPLLMDSLDAIEIAMDIENHYAFLDDDDIPDEVTNGWQTVGQVIEYVKTRVKENV